VTGGTSRGRDDAAPGSEGWSRRLEELDAQLAAVGAGSDAGPGGDRADDAEVLDDPVDPADNGHQPMAATGDGLLAMAVTRPTASDDRADADGPDANDRGDGLTDRTGDDDDDDERDVTAKRRRKALIDWVVVIGVALFVAFLVRTFVLAHFVVDGVSMTSTLQDEDRVFVNKLSYRLHDPNRGDVVVLHQLNGTSERDLIKRVIGLPGESLQYQDCQVLIDGRVLDEPYLDPEALMPGSCGRDVGLVDIPDDHVFVMGDNRGGSMDSRDLGPINDDELVGRAFVVFWPSSNWQWL